MGFKRSRRGSGGRNTAIKEMSEAASGAVAEAIKAAPAEAAVAAAAREAAEREESHLVVVDTQPRVNAQPNGFIRAITAFFQLLGSLLSMAFGRSANQGTPATPPVAPHLDVADARGKKGAAREGDKGYYSEDELEGPAPGVGRGAYDSHEFSTNPPAHEKGTADGGVHHPSAGDGD